jgi:hypothetical protein
MNSFFSGFEKRAAFDRDVNPDAVAAGTALTGAGVTYGGHRLARRGAGISDRAQKGIAQADRLRDASVNRSTNKYWDVADRLDTKRTLVQKPKNLWQRITGKRDPNLGRKLEAIDRAQSHARNRSSQAEALAQKTHATRTAKLQPAMAKGKTISTIGKGVRGLGVGALLGAGLYGYNKLRG